MKVKKLDWDSEFFGLRVGVIKISEGEEIDRDEFHNFDLIYVIVHSESFIRDKILGVPISRKVNFAMEVGREFQGSPDSCINPYRGGSDERLIEIGKQSGEYSRFKKDTRLPRGSFERLYQTWMRRSIDKEIADENLVWSSPENIMGILTIKTDNAHGEIGILSVDKETRGSGIGTKLIDAAKTYTFSHGCTTLKVATQEDNNIAMNFYLRCGFHIESTDTIYHLWMEGPAFI
jgi:dTDP-4-amino-4,6-dideoxy-D-galactose acyltransferase